MDSKLINGNSLEVLKDYDDNSVDLLCTDPPYGYGFMGKSWDQTLPSKDIFRECYRVLKPGSFAFVMSAPRSDVQYRMVQLLEEVGFEVGYTPIYWAYATGFPKALNIGKSVTKRGDIDEAKKLDGSYAGYQPKPAVEVVIVSMKPLEQKGYVDQALDNQKGVTWLDDCRIPFAGMSDEEQFEKDNVAGMMNFDGKYEKGEGKMYDGGWEKPKRDGLSRGTHASRKSKSDTYERVSAFGDSKQSETKDGRNLWGKKATKKVKITKRKPREEDTVFKTSGFKSEDNDTAEASPLGRFAANLLVSDNVLDTGNKTKSSGGRIEKKTGWGEFGGGKTEVIDGQPGKGDVGDFSRYYSLDEWWKFRMSRLPEEIQRTFPFLIVPKASKSEKNKGCEGMEEKPREKHHIGQLGYDGESWIDRKDGKGKVPIKHTKGRYLPQKNNHPTVKPISLMSYLVTLGSRKGDIVLDPFMGSGTTTVSCVISERKYLGIEREKEYFEIAESRVDKAKNPANLVKHDFF